VDEVFSFGAGQQGVVRMEVVEDDPREDRHDA
jgi:hypothetical protein